MKRGIEVLALTLLAGTLAAGQSRPTLGPAEPSLGGRGGATTTSARRLLRVRAIFVEPIDNNLNVKIVAGLKRMSWAQVVSTRKQADAVLSGTCFDSPHLKIVHSEIFINDRATGGSIWQDEVRLPYRPPPLAQAVDESAREILANLRASLAQARGQ